MGRLWMESHPQNLMPHWAKGVQRSTTQMNRKCFFLCAHKNSYYSTTELQKAAAKLQTTNNPKGKFQNILYEATIHEL